MPADGAVLEVVAGMDLAPVMVDIGVEQVPPGTVRVALGEPLGPEGDGWVSGDTHVHFLAPSTALLQARAEGVNVVHLLATQWGDHHTSITDLDGDVVSDDGSNAVWVGSENRQNMLGHIGLVGSRTPIMPFASGGPPEGPIGGPVTHLMADWLRRCRESGGLAVGAHFPLPMAEIAADIDAGLLDALEVQTFDPTLESPPIREWYRYLDAGYRLPLVGGTDKMTATVPLGQVRTWARLDGRVLSFDAWADAVRAGRTFVTSGPLLELRVDGHEPGDAIAIDGTASLEVDLVARAAQPVISDVELVLDGVVVAFESSPAPVTELAIRSARDRRALRLAGRSFSQPIRDRLSVRDGDGSAHVARVPRAPRPTEASVRSRCPARPRGRDACVARASRAAPKPRGARALRQLPGRGGAAAARAIGVSVTTEAKPRGPLRIAFQVWGQYVGWSELMAMGQRIDELGFESLWSNDHLLPVVGGGPVALEAERGPVWDGWMTLAAWAERTTRVRLGCLVSGAAYRDPTLLVRMATALDHASGGRAVLGIGAGWHATEHAAFGFEYPPLGQRLDRLEEAAAICRQMLDGQDAFLEGTWYDVRGARNDPPPIQPRLPLLIGGSGERRTLPLVARYADMWNGEGDPDTYARKSALLDELCRQQGRDPGSIVRTVGCPPPLIRDDRSEAEALLAERLVRHGLDKDDAHEAVVASPFVGPLEGVASHLARYVEAGASEVIFDWPWPPDEDTLVALAGPVREEIDRLVTGR